MAETYVIDTDIPVLCITASSFPEGIKAAHEKLHSLISLERRETFGISYPLNKKIVYMAGATELGAEEAEALGLERFTIKKGVYLSELLKDWMKDETRVSETFRKLLAHPGIEWEQGYCLEIYKREDMLCLVPMKNS